MKAALGLGERSTNTINWDDRGASIKIVQTVNEGVPFVVVVKGTLAKAFISAFGIAPVGITPEQAHVIIYVVAILAVASLVLYALANGYKVTGKARTKDGTEYELRFEPKPKT